MSVSAPAAAEPSVPPPDPAPVGPGGRYRGSTPALFRLLALAAVVALVLLATVGFLAAASLTESSDRAERNTGPVLVAAQDVFASIAEADAASTAVFLSGAAEDREQRRLYELAIERSTGQLEEVSRLVGDDDEAHESIKAISARLASYTGLVERARLANTAGLDGAEASLRDAITSVQDGIVPEVQAITARAQDRLDDDVSGGQAVTILAALVGLATVAVLVWGQLLLSRRTRRLLNLPLVGATVLVVVAVAWLGSAWVRQQNDLELARDGGYESIALTADIQTSAFRYKTLESLSVLAGGSGDEAAEQTEIAEALAAIPIDADLIEAARTGEAAGSGLLIAANRAADSTREQAATGEMLERWQRYQRTSGDIRTALAGDRDAAVELAIGPGNADFNGFNTSVESVLSDNRSQFTAGLADARNHLDWLQLVTVALPALAAALALWGYQLRIREYRR
jgi:CHASE3 domain sensor protein